MGDGGINEVAVKDIVKKAVQQRSQVLTNLKQLKDLCQYFKDLSRYFRENHIPLRELVKEDRDYLKLLFGGCKFEKGIECPSYSIGAWARRFLGCRVSGSNIAYYFRHPSQILGDLIILEWGEPNFPVGCNSSKPNQFNAIPPAAEVIEKVKQAYRLIHQLCPYTLNNAFGTVVINFVGLTPEYLEQLGVSRADWKKLDFEEKEFGHHLKILVYRDEGKRKEFLLLWHYCMARDFFLHIWKSADKLKERHKEIAQVWGDTSSFILGDEILFHQGKEVCAHRWRWSSEEKIYLKSELYRIHYPNSRGSYQHFPTEERKTSYEYKLLQPLILLGYLVAYPQVSGEEVKEVELHRIWP